MNTIMPTPQDRQTAYTPCRNFQKTCSGEVGMDETFYLNGNFSDTAAGSILNCFAVGVSRWGGDWCIKKEYEHYISFNLFLEGGVIIQTGDITFDVRAGDLLIARRSPLMMRTPPGGMARKYCLLLSNTTIQSAICDFLQPNDPGLLRMQDPQQIKLIMENILELVKHDHSGRELNRMIFDFLQEVQTQTVTKHLLPPLLEKALAILRKNEFRISRFELAQLCNVSPRTLTRLFDRFLHCPPGQYIIRCRLEKAARMLNMSHEPVKNIAYECGFSSPMFFAREFRQHYQCTPSEFRHSKNGKTI